MDGELIGRDRELEQIVELVGAGRGVLLVGNAGVGKSHLASRVAALIAQEGSAHVEFISGTVPGRTITFGAVAHLLEPTGGSTEAVAIQQIVERLERTIAGGGVVVVDDVDLLDDASQTALHRLSSRAPVVATARADESTDPFVVGLWKDGRLERINVGPVDRAASDEIARLAVGGAIDGDLADELWRRSGGNPLLTRELCIAGVGSGAITEGTRSWALTGELLGGQRIIDLIRHRLDELDDNMIVSLLATVLLDPLPFETVVSLGRGDDIGDLIRRRLIIETTTAERTTLRPAHPIVAEAVRAMTSPTRLARLADELARIDGPGLKPGDARQIATVIGLAGRSPQPATAIAGASAALATFDYTHAEQLAKLAIAQTESLEATQRATAHLLQGRALAGLGRIAEATGELERAADAAPDRTHRVMAVQALAEILMFNAARPHEAIDHLTGLLAEDDDEVNAAPVRLQLALAYGIVDELKTADRLASTLVDNDELPPSVQLPALMVHTLARSMTGRVDDVDHALDRGEALAVTLHTSQPLARDQVAMNRVLTAQARADLASAGRIVADVRQSDDFPNRLQGPWFYIDLMAEILRGNLTAAVVDAERAIALHRVSDPVGTAAMAMSLGGLVHAMSGETTAARQLVDEAIGAGAEHQARCRVWIGFAEAWIAGLDGDVAAAASMAADAGRRAIEAWHTVWGAIAAHGAVRFGAPEVVRDLLGSLDAGPLVDMLRDHAHADTTVALTKSAVQFGVHGMHALAAETWASIALADDADALTRTHAAMRSVSAGARCPGLCSPLLARVESPLSPRQHEIAERAAAGQASRQIADALYVATKTVENHLQAIYRALGIGSRTELAELLRD